MKNIWKMGRYAKEVEVMQKKVKRRENIKRIIVKESVHD